MIKNEPGVLGPSREFSAVLLEEGVGRCIVELDSTVSFLAVDLSDASLADMREYDPVTDSTEPILPYDVNEPNALPKVSTVLTLIVEWIETLASERLNLYSAREEHENGPTPAPRKVSPKKAGTAGKATLASLASQLVSMQQQLQVVVAQQGAMTRDQSGMGGAAIHAPVPSPGPMVGKVPALSSGLLAGTAPKTAANLVGPPPRTKAVPQPVPDVGLQAGPIQGSYAGGVRQPSRQHFDAAEHSIDSAGGASHWRGSNLRFGKLFIRNRPQFEYQRRCKERENAERSCHAEQQLFPPGAAAALQENESSASSAQKRKRTGAGRHLNDGLHGVIWGYRNCKETGMIMWILAHAMDAAAQDDFHATKEYLALLTASLEQSALDGGWGIAYVLSLMEEPPQQIFADRLQTAVCRLAICAPRFHQAGRRWL